MLGWSVSKRIDGLWVGCFDDKPEPRLQRVEEALNLIKTYDRGRYERIIRDLERIWVLVIPGKIAAFDSSIWACLLDPRHVLDDAKSPERIATSIVHEATHARLWRRGIGYEEKLRSRVEAICFRRERAFAAKLPNGEQLRELADRNLLGYKNQEYWTDEAFRARYYEDALEGLKYLGTPNWLMQILKPVFSRRFKSTRQSGPSGC